MSFARSDALFPPPELAAAISAEFEGQCRLLCYGPYPSWAEIQARLEELRDRCEPDQKHDGEESL